jgi:hypothetical protein
MLLLYLKRAGVISGPLSKHTSHSGLEAIKNALLGNPPFKQEQRFLIFGTALHELFLENKKAGAYNSLTPLEQRTVEAMVKALNKTVVVRALMEGGVREVKVIQEFKGVLLATILDNKQERKKVGFDLKSTTATTMSDFMGKAEVFGYPRQGLTYKLTAALNDFFFVAVSKKFPHPVFVYNLTDHNLKAAEGELDFLIYFYKVYGKITIGETAQAPKQQVEQQSKTNNKMTGKDALAGIKEAASEFKTAKSEAKKAMTALEKAAKKVDTLIGKFPKKEVELYQEKLDAIKSSIALVTE